MYNTKRVSVTPTSCKELCAIFSSELISSYIFPLFDNHARACDRNFTVLSTKPYQTAQDLLLDAEASKLHTESSELGYKNLTW
jgi:hypothetical protein